jgi:prepilin peptidase CpaA
MGGGDVKMFAAGAMTAPPWLVPSQILAISLAGGVLGLVYLLLRRFSPRPAETRPASRVGRILRAERWRIRRGAPLPYGCAICAGIVFTLLQG